MWAREVAVVVKGYSGGEGVIVWRLSEVGMIRQWQDYDTLVTLFFLNVSDYVVCSIIVALSISMVKCAAAIFCARYSPWRPAYLGTVGPDIA
jgi:hypothetical protein